METLFAELISGLILTFVIFLSLIISTLIGAGMFYASTVLVRMRKREAQALKMATIEVQVPKDNEIKVDAAEQLFSSLAGLSRKKGFWGLYEVGDAIAFEIIATKGRLGFYITVPEKLRDLLEKQIYAFYPDSSIEIVEEKNIFSENGNVAYAGLKLKEADYKPIKTYKDLPTDSLSIITSAMAKMDDG